MIRINLLPFRAARRQENVKHQVIVFLLSLLLLVAVGFWGHNFMAGMVEAKEIEKKEKQADLDRVSQIAKEVDELKKAIAEVEKRLKVIDTLKADRTAAVHLLDEMTQIVVPKRMWLTTLDQDDKKITLEGVAVDNKTVANFLQNLEETGRYKEVQLIKVAALNKAANALKKFQIICWKPASNEEEEGEV